MTTLLDNTVIQGVIILVTITFCISILIIIIRLCSSRTPIDSKKDIEKDNFLIKKNQLTKKQIKEYILSLLLKEKLIVNNYSYDHLEISNLDTKTDKIITIIKSMKTKEFDIGFLDSIEGRIKIINDIFRSDPYRKENGGYYRFDGVEANKYFNDFFIAIKKIKE